MAKLTVQATKQARHPGDKPATAVAIIVGALFVAVNGLVVLFVEPSQMDMLTTIANTLMLLLTLFVPQSVCSAVMGLAIFAVKVGCALAQGFGTSVAATFARRLCCPAPGE